MQAHVGDLPVRRRAEVDRRDPAAGGRRPRRPEELLAGGDQVVGAAARALGVEQQHGRVRGQQVDQQLHRVDEGRGEGLHALDGDAGRHLVGELEQLRVGRAELRTPSAYVLGQQQLAARRRPQSLHRPQGALVGDRERADLLHLVAPELHPQRVLLGGREDVDDAAAHRELPAALHHVDAGVRRLREAAHDVVDRPGLPRNELDGLDVGQAGHLGLEQAPDGRDDHAQRTVGGVGPGVAQAPEDGEPAAHGVAARAQPLVRQRLPARVVGDRRGVDEVGQLLHEVLGLSRRRRHGQDGASALHQPVHHEGADGGRAGQVEGRLHRPVGERGTQGGGGRQVVRRRRRVARTARDQILREHAGRPPSATGWGCSESLRVPPTGCGVGAVSGGVVLLEPFVAPSVGPDHEFH